MQSSCHTSAHFTQRRPDNVLPCHFGQGVSGPAAAKAAWSAAGIDLAQLLPSFANSPADVDQLLQKHEAHYLLD
jgi:hypothetical protein